MPAFNPVCTSTYCFDRSVDIESLREALHTQCAVFPKYRQKLAVRDKLFHPPFYVDDPDFSLDRHLQLVELPEPAGPRELNTFVRSGPATDCRGCIKTDYPVLRLVTFP